LKTTPSTRGRGKAYRERKITKIVDRKKMVKKKGVLFGRKKKTHEGGQFTQGDGTRGIEEVEKKKLERIGN